jgi:hypothetical protein
LSYPASGRVHQGHPQTHNRKNDIPDCPFYDLRPRADWPYNHVGKIPRGPFSLRQSGAPNHFFFFCQHYCFEPPIALFFLGPLKKKPIKIWGAQHHILWQCSETRNESDKCGIQSTVWKKGRESSKKLVQ